MEGCRGAIRFIRRRGFTFVLVGETRYFYIAELKFPNKTFENHQPFRALDGIVVEMCMSGKNWIDPDGGEFVQEPLWVKAC